ncbi:hypothetical protein LXL04_002532 [Taraxacum kok-saghyz]
MARGLLMLPHYSAQSHLIRTGLSSPSKSFTKFHTFSIPKKSTYVRLLCSYSFNLQDDSTELSNYKETFSNRMAMAGLKPHHRIAVGVSGGPDSMALCLLAADWKTNGLNAASRRNKDSIDGLLAIIVDHGLRPESKDEAEIVQRRVLDMGIRCEIAHCKWTDGKPKLGHLQEAARDMRYEKLQNVCIQHHIGVLLIAHHADDQAELFILRLSRNSGVLGLAGMALTTQLFDDKSSNSILLVRPLLDFSKQDLYKICEEGKQEWVEDPTNQKTIFARNRIRMALGNHSSSIFKSELQAIISSCRMTRVYVDHICCTLLNQVVTVMPEGYAVIDLGTLNPSKVPDICLSKFITLLLQFISQRQRPVRGSAQKLLLDYIRTLPCKSCFTAAGCYLCPSPGSKGTKLLICYSVNSTSPTKMESFYISNNEKVNISSELNQIIENGKLHLNKMFLNINPSDVPFINTKSSESILTEAKHVKIISDSTFETISSLQNTEHEKFIKNEILSDQGSRKVVESSGVDELREGQIGHFMGRFLVSWEFVASSGSGCGQYTVMGMRHMVDDDWLYLSMISKSENLWSDFVKNSAREALRVLKSIPVAARRSLPVIVNPENQILSMPNVGFSICGCLKVSVKFSPRVPLGGGYSSFL